MNDDDYSPYRLAMGELARLVAIMGVVLALCMLVYFTAPELNSFISGVPN